MPSNTGSHNSSMIAVCQVPIDPQLRGAAVGGDVAVPQPDARQVAGPGEGLPEAAGMPRVAESTGPVSGVALTLITAGSFVAITGWWMAIWRDAGRPGA